ncbi:hypothetical protein [Nostoc commune]|uniref:hypothetical protein n=1 Tax=Nostoc commune TaxID=1178 RepID=UPI002073BA90|nr:hypothetical protein [Nostoc commune]
MSRKRILIALARSLRHFKVSDRPYLMKNSRREPKSERVMQQLPRNLANHCCGDRICGWGTVEP